MKVLNALNGGAIGGVTDNEREEVEPTKSIYISGKITGTGDTYKLKFSEKNL